MTHNESRFNRTAKKLTRYLSDETILRIRNMQPWSIAEGALKRNGIEITADRVDQVIWLDPLLRLSRLDNLDKHREVLALDFHRATITLGDDDFDLLDDGGSLKVSQFAASTNSIPKPART